jgi:dTDP-4-dehydrorhamnose reductase
MKKVLVTGASGMLGSALCPLLERHGWEVYPTDIRADKGGMELLDIQDKRQLERLAALRRPDVIFHLAAETDVDRCEREKEYAWSANVNGTKNIAEICRKEKILMVYISTSGVFDGRKATPYTESDEPNPINVYAKTKWEGEQAVMSLLKEYFIVRAGWMFGGYDKDKKFVGKIINLLKTQKRIKAVSDKFGSPTFTEDLSCSMAELINRGSWGLYHAVNQGCCSRYDMACKIVEYLSLDDVRVEPVGSDAFSLDAKRGNSEVLDSSKLGSLGIHTRPWQDALKEYVAGFKGLFKR